MLLLTNHIGYETQGPKQAVLLCGQTQLMDDCVLLVCARSHQTVAKLAIEWHGKVDNWHQGQFHRIDFSDFTAPGNYYLRLEHTHSATFTIARGVLMQRTFSDVLHYFKSQRCSGQFDQQDKQVPLLGTSTTADVHGGWYDASGDVSKYLSHLSYANYLNPQQTPLVVWNMLKGLAVLQHHSGFASFSRTRLKDEALFGADFLHRMQNSEGFFYMTVFDKWSKDTKQREICAYATQQGHKSDDYQAGFRQGGGMAIAALAAAARLDTHGEFTQADYLQAAEKGYWHLKEHNLAYLNDGVENIIDEYCALLACCELYRTTENDQYLTQAREWAQRLAKRQCSDEQITYYWSATSNGERPYFHASDAGLPVIALCEYLNIETDTANYAQLQRVVEQACQFELAITQQVSNPFGYPRQYVKGVESAKRTSFFIAQDNESGYWWQGENARLASLASMAYLAQPHLSTAIAKPLEQWSQNALNWIVGLNPYNMCMLDGHGHNNPDYLPHLGFFNAKGGVCNGITAGFDDPRDIAFNPAGQKDDMLQNWRWGEQWIPHGAWYLLAIISQFAHFTAHGEENQ
ncbi:glycoside hydrolase family 9 protein [Vibrio cholerae]|uniref:glycoside hydrolase family 9 protein n=1 Tax=Vibrio cholerae TaxID=666 RepID=UPI001DE86C80|nr:glycoside hydrolase family 9 protein [Vibrio cholerae]EGR1093278.1 chitobiase [Vibrio cholerae]MCD1193340.1 chitobiase [Vibrio cholerae]MCD1197437.1 chitobiase [Vibrio cholerae]MCD1209957.1 chitobiase [Vibrio cholerae]MCD1247215.1 chitobiase [Vibrio cholerae]